MKQTSRVITAILVNVVLLFSANTAFATPTKIINTTCIWNSQKGEFIKQSCKVWSNSSAGAGTYFFIKWADGVETQIHSSGNSGYYVSRPSGRAATLHGSHPFDRTSFPKQIHITGFGTIEILYENFFITGWY
jgi:hypothetical protein